MLLAICLSLPEVLQAVSAVYVAADSSVLEQTVVHRAAMRAAFRSIGAVMQKAVTSKCAPQPLPK